MLDGTDPHRPTEGRPVTARLLLPMFDAVYLLALASWVGSVLFFSFGVAPVIFRVLGKESGGRFVRVLFPRYYAWGVVSGAIALPAFAAVPMAFPEYRGPWVGVQAGLILAGILIFLYCGNSLTPAINAARDEGPEGAERFDRLHKRSVQLNAAALLLGVVLLGVHATRRPPRTRGIEELTPQQALEYDREVEATIRKRVLTDAEVKEINDLIDARRGRPPTPTAPADSGTKTP
jgi:hypothetical protein